METQEHVDIIWYNSKENVIQRIIGFGLKKLASRNRKKSRQMISRHVVLPKPGNDGLFIGNHPKIALFQVSELVTVQFTQIFVNSYFCWLKPCL
jgi:hypothetical protein